MDRAPAPASANDSVTFRDGIGERRIALDANGQASHELLCVRGELSAVPAFEFALRERVSRLAAFRHAYYAQVRSVERLNGPDATLGLLSDRADGIRLSDLFVRAAARGLNLDVNAAICLIRQLVPAVARLHESSSDIAHAALGPERIVVTPQARLVITEYALGAALEQLRYSQERYWKDLRIALPRSAGLPHFDQRADVTQVGVIALSLILGRLLRDDEYPSRIGDVVASAWAVSPKGGFEPLPPGIRGWLARALQLDARNSFANAIEANAEFDRVLGDSEYIGLPASLESFLARYQAAEAIELFSTETAPPVQIIAPFSLANPVTMPAAPPAVQSPQPTIAEAKTSEAKTLESKIIDSKISETPIRETKTPDERIFEARIPEPPPAPEAKVSEAKVSEAKVAEAKAPAWDVSPSSSLNSAFLEAMLGDTPKSPADELQSVAASVAHPRAPVPLPRTPKPAAEPAATLDVLVSPFTKLEAERPKAEADQHTRATTARGDDLAPISGIPPTMFGRHQTKPSGGSKLWLGLGAGAIVLVAIGIPLTRTFMTKAAPPPALGTLAIATNPSGATAVIDGKPSGTTPVTLTLLAGSHTVEIRGDGEPRSIPVMITAGAQMSQYIELAKAAPVVGQLSVRSEPAGAAVTIDGVRRGTTPMIVSDLLPGDHAVVLDGDAGSVKQNVSIESGVLASLVVPMGTAAAVIPATGWLGVTSPIEIQIRQGDKVLGASSDRIMLPVGRHDIELVNDTLAFRATRTVQITAGKTSSVTVEVPRGTIALNAVPWADVWLDGERIGETPIGNLAVPIGVHDLVFRHPELGEQHHQLTVSLGGVARLSVDLRKR